MFGADSLNISAEGRYSGGKRKQLELAARVDVLSWQSTVISTGTCRRLGVAFQYVFRLYKDQGSKFESGDYPVS